LFRSTAGINCDSCKGSLEFVGAQGWALEEKGNIGGWMKYDGSETRGNWTGREYLNKEPENEMDGDVGVHVKR